MCKRERKWSKGGNGVDLRKEKCISDIIKYMEKEIRMKKEKIRK